MSGDIREAAAKCVRERDELREAIKGAHVIVEAARGEIARVTADRDEAHRHFEGAAQAHDKLLAELATERERADKAERELGQYVDAIRALLPVVRDLDAHKSQCTEMRLFGPCDKCKELDAAVEFSARVLARRYISIMSSAWRRSRGTED